jgi:hypothetical protein
MMRPKPEILQIDPSPYVLRFMNCGIHATLEGLAATLYDQAHLARTADEITDHAAFLGLASCHIFDLSRASGLAHASTWGARHLGGEAAGRTNLLLFSLVDPAWVNPGIWDADGACVVSLLRLNPVLFSYLSPLEARARICSYCDRTITNAGAHCTILLPFVSDSLVLIFAGKDLLALLDLATLVGQLFVDDQPDIPLFLQSQVIPGLRAPRQSTGDPNSVSTDCFRGDFAAVVLTRSVAASAQAQPPFDAPRPPMPGDTSSTQRFHLPDIDAVKLTSFLQQANGPERFVVRSRAERSSSDPAATTTGLPPIDLLGAKTPPRDVHGKVSLNSPSLNEEALQFPGAHLQVVELLRLYGRVQNALATPFQAHSFLDLVGSLREFNESYVRPWNALAMKTLSLATPEQVHIANECCVAYAEEVVGTEDSSKPDEMMNLLAARRDKEIIIQNSCKILRNSINEREQSIFFDEPMLLGQNRWLSETCRKAAATICVAALKSLRNQHSGIVNGSMYWKGCCTSGLDNRFLFYPPRLISIPSPSEMTLADLVALVHECGHVHYGDNQLAKLLYKSKAGQRPRESKVLRNQQEEIYTEVGVLLTVFQGNAELFGQHYLERVSVHFEFCERVLLRNPKNPSDSVTDFEAAESGRMADLNNKYMLRLFGVLVISEFVDLKGRGESIPSFDDYKTVGWRNFALNALNKLRQILDSRVGKGCLLREEWKRNLAFIKQQVEELRWNTTAEVPRFHPEVAFVPSVAMMAYHMYERIIRDQHEDLLTIAIEERREDSTADHRSTLDETIAALLKGQITVGQEFDPLMLIRKAVELANLTTTGDDLPRNLPFNVVVAGLVSLADRFDESLNKAIR